MPLIDPSSASAETVSHIHRTSAWIILATLFTLVCTYVNSFTRLRQFLHTRMHVYVNSFTLVCAHVNFEFDFVGMHLHRFAGMHLHRFAGMHLHHFDLRDMYAPTSLRSLPSRRPSPAPRRAAPPSHHVVQGGPPGSGRRPVSSVNKEPMWLVREVS